MEETRGETYIEAQDVSEIRERLGLRGVERIGFLQYRIFILFFTSCFNLVLYDWQIQHQAPEPNPVGVQPAVLCVGRATQCCAVGIFLYV